MNSKTNTIFIRKAGTQEKSRVSGFKYKKKCLSSVKLRFLCGKNICLLLGLLLGGSIPAFSESLSSFDTRPEWNLLLGKDHFLAHLIETGDPQTDLLHRTWFENEIAQALQQPATLSALRQSIVAGDAPLQETLFDSLLTLNLPSDYARARLMEWILGSDSALRPHLRAFSTSPAIRIRFAAYLLQHHEMEDQICERIKEACESQNPYLERSLKKQVNHLERIDWSLFGRYPHLTPQTQLEFRWTLFRNFQSKNTASEPPACNAMRNIAGRSALQVKNNNFSSLLWKQLLQKIERNPALKEEYYKRIQQRDEPERWMREALTSALQKNEADAWFQSYLQAAQLPKSRYRAVFNALIQSRSEKRARPELIAESSHERTPWRARLVELVRSDSRWSSYFLWHLTRAAEPITLQFRRSLPALFAQHETLSLEWYRWNSSLTSHSAPLNSQQLKAWGIRWGEILRDQEAEWFSLWMHHDLPTQALLQKTLIVAMDENPSLVTTWASIVQQHQAPLQSSMALWTRQNSPNPEMTNFPLFLNKLVASIQRKEWLGNVDLSVFRTAFGNFLQTQEGWNQVTWRIGLESYQIATPLRNMLTQQWSQNPENFWKLIAWRTLFSPDPQFQQKMRKWIQTVEISEKTLLALSQQNPEIQVASQSLWIDLFQKNLVFREALTRKTVHPTQQDDLDQLLYQIPVSQRSATSLIQEILIRGGDATLADWILRRSDLQTFWRVRLEEELVQNPEFLKNIIQALTQEKIISETSFQTLVSLLMEDRLFFETLLSDPSLGFKKINSTPNPL